MGLIQSDAKGKRVSLTVELDKKTNAALKKYLRFSGADLDRVVAGALQRLFEDDEDFVPWVKDKDQKAKERADRRAQKETSPVAAVAR